MTTESSESESGGVGRPGSGETDRPGAREGARPGSGPIFLLLLAIALAFFVNLGNAPLFDRDEGAFSEATREMLESGNYVSTTLNGEPRYDKPILTYYAQAVGVTILGWNEWGLRLHSALAATVWILVIWGFARREWDEATGWVAAILGATSLWVIIIGRAATADALLNLFLTLTLVDLYRFWKEDRKTPLYRVFLWSALGFLTKGPIAVAIPLVSAFLLSLVRGQVPRYLKAIFNPLGWLIFFGVAGPWYWAVYQRDGQAFIDGFFLSHNLNRFADTMEGHGGNLLYFVPVALLILLPHTTLFLRTLTRIRDGMKNDLDLFLWLWFGFVFLFFSVSSTQLPHYLLYGATPLFLLMARYRGDLKNRFLALLPALFLAGLLFGLPLALPWIEPMVEDGFTRAVLTVAPQAFDLEYRIWTGLGLAAVLGLFFIRTWQPWKHLVAAGLVVAATVALGLFPTYGEIQQGPTREAALLARNQEWDVVMWRLDMPSFAVYYGDITPLREPRPGEVVFTRITRLDRLEMPTDILFQKGGIVLARVLETGGAAGSETAEAGAPDPVEAGVPNPAQGAVPETGEAGDPEAGGPRANQ